jgi:hypothetical protein
MAEGPGRESWRPFFLEDSQASAGAGESRMRPQDKKFLFALPIGKRYQ